MKAIFVFTLILICADNDFTTRFFKLFIRATNIRLRKLKAVVAATIIIYTVQCAVEAEIARTYVHL